MLSQTGEIVNALGGFSADTYSLSGVGTLNIDTAGGGSVGDTMVVDTFFNWLNNANIGGSSTGVLQIPGGVTMTKAGGTQSIFNITLDNQGTFQHNSGLLQLVDATIDNSGNYDIALDESISNAGGSPVFNNFGTFNKTAGAGTTTINANVTFIQDPAGEVQVQSGTLNIPSFATNPGTVTLANDATLITAGAFSNTGILQGIGTIDPVTLTNPGTINPGTTPGTITIAGDADFTGGILNFEVDGLTPGTEHDQIIVTGSATLGGTINVVAGFAPAQNDTFDLITCGGTGCSGTFGTENLPADFSLANLGGIVQLTFATCAGTICWDDGGGDGLWLTATNWTTDLLPGGLDDVVIDFGGGNTVTLSSGVQSINSLINEDTLIINGSATLNLATTSTSNGDLSLSTTLGGTGDLTVNGLFTWSSPGTTLVNIAGGLTTAATSTVSLSGNGTKQLDTGWTNQGIVNWNDGDFLLNASTFDNDATFNILTADNNDRISGTGTFNNNATGTVNKTLGGEIEFQPGAGTNNAGLFDIDAGEVEFQTPTTTTATGVFDIDPTATLNFTSATHNVANPNAFVSAGPGAQLIIDGSATVNLNTSISLDPDIDLSLSTTLGGTGDLTVNGLFTWSSPGTTFVGLAGGLTTAATSTVSLSGNGTKQLDTG